MVTRTGIQQFRSNAAPRSQGVLGNVRGDGAMVPVSGQITRWKVERDT